MKRKLIVLMAIMFAAVTSAWAENSVIFYTAKTNKAVKPYKNDAFKDADGNTLTITDNTYKDGQGRIEFDGELKTIGEDAFYYKTDLTTLIIPDGVTSIGKYAFYKCSGLTSIYLPKSVSSLGNYVFFGCSNLKSLALPENPAFNTLSQNLLNGFSGLEDLTIPSTITSFENYVFEDLSNLKAVYLPHSTPPTITSLSLNKAPKGVVYYINSDAESSYRNHGYWKSKNFSLLPSIKYYSSDGNAVELDEDVKAGFGAGVVFVDDVFDNTSVNI